MIIIWIIVFVFCNILINFNHLDRVIKPRKQFNKYLLGNWIFQTTFFKVKRSFVEKLWNRSQDMLWIFSQKSEIIVDVDLFPFTMLLYPLAWDPLPRLNGEEVKNVTWSWGMSHTSEIFNIDFSVQITCPFKVLYFDPNPISIVHLVAEIWIFFEVQKQFKS